MPLKAAVRGLLVSTVALTSVLSACSTHADQTQHLDGWRTIRLPEQLVPSTLLVSGDTVLVGGSRTTGAGRSPALVALPSGGSDDDPVPVSVIPTTPYGKVADLVYLTGSPDASLVGIGAAHGGAHANFRWTIWTGTPNRLVDQPQTFETFGGWEAGTLLGLATDSRGAVVLGTWQGEHGADGAVWRADGDRWVRDPTAAALANTAQRQVAPQTVSQQTDGSVTVNGSVIDLADGVHQSAAFWRDVGGSWSLTVMADPGRRSLAWSTACAASCWTVGERDGAVAVWSGAGLAELPRLAASDEDRGVVLLVLDRVVVPVSSDGAGLLLVGAGNRWRAYTAPAGRVLSAQLVGTRLYLVTGHDDNVATLSVRDLADVLDR